MARREKGEVVAGMRLASGKNHFDLYVNWAYYRRCSSCGCRMEFGCTMIHDSFTGLSEHEVCPDDINAARVQNNPALARSRFIPESTYAIASLEHFRSRMPDVHIYYQSDSVAQSA